MTWHFGYFLKIVKTYANLKKPKGVISVWSKIITYLCKN